MVRQSLNGKWQMRRADDTKMYQADVPGSLYNDLINANELPVPYYKEMNSKAYLEATEHDYVYIKSFDIDDETFSNDNVYLVCEGLDTLCELTLNGTKIGDAYNMHRTWRYDIKNIAKKCNNKLEILFKSPVKYAEAEYKKDFYIQIEPALKGIATMRKSQCMSGWDWAPIMPDAGIWRDIFIEGYNRIKINGVRTEQTHRADGSVLLDVFLDAECPENAEYVINFGDEEYIFHDKHMQIEVKNPRLWYPVGYGEQYLYDFSLCVRCDDESDTYSCRIGLRKCETVLDDDELGQTMYFRINGLPIFAKGANYVPEDSLLANVTKERTRKLLSDAVRGNHNGCVRLI